MIPSSKSETRSPKLLALPLLLCVSAAMAGDLSTLVRDRAAIERVYYHHRLGTKPPFEQVSPPALIERLVRQDLRKETALKRVYGVEITPAMLDAEVKRINTTTRAPEMLAEVKAALGNDPEKFANAFAKPFLVERLPRDKFVKSPIPTGLILGASAAFASLVHAQSHIINWHATDGGEGDGKFYRLFKP